MEYSTIFSRLRNDILHSKYPQAYYINQENKINQLNTGQKPASSWKYFIDGYKICVNGETFYGSFRYDKLVQKCKPMSFQSFSNHAGVDFLHFINTIISADESIFLLVNHLEIFDLRTSLFEVKDLVINHTVVDNLCISTVLRFLPNLESITFDQCTIQRQCDFSKIKSNIVVNRSVIEDFRVFNDTTANLRFSEANIEKVANTKVYSKTIEFHKMKHFNFKQLFLKCAFPKLENLMIYTSSNKVGMSYGNDFLFLPKSAPKLENLRIEGKVDSFDFLIQLANLLRCDIESIYDDFGLFYPDVTSKKERNQLKHRNLQKYEIQKILDPDSDDSFIIGKLELERILRLARFYKLLSYTEEEKNLLFKDPNILQYIVGQKIEDGEVTKFYELFFDTLCLRNTENEKDVRLGLDDTLGIQNGIMYTYCNRDIDAKRKSIVLTKSFMYNYDNKPIVFMGSKKLIRTKEDALLFNEKFPHSSTLKHNDFDFFIEDSFIEDLKKMSEEEKITLGDLMDMIWDLYGYQMKPQDLKKLGKGGRFIAGLLEKSGRMETEYNTIYNKNLHYRDLLKRIIFRNYKKFTIAEKIVLVVDSEKYNIHHYSTGLDVYGINEDYDEELIKSIDIKTDGLYSKYMGMLKLTYTQFNNYENRYSLPIENEYIKKLNLKK